MLIESTQAVRGFIRFLNQKNLCDTICEVVLLPDNDTIEGKGNGEENIGFAAYCPATMVIYVAGDTSQLVDIDLGERFDIIHESLARAYIHHIQNISTGKFDEEEAESQAVKLVREYNEAREQRIREKKAGTAKPVCPNGCGEFKTTYGQVFSYDMEDNSDGFFKVKVVYCPKCSYIYGADAD